MIRLRCQYNLLIDEMEFVLAEYGDNGRVISFAKQIEMVERTPDKMAEISFRLTPDMARSLMDELWNNGVRPSKEGSIGQIEAVKYHLEDMRKLVFERGKG